MNRILTVLILSLLAQPALAEELSPIQMYLQGEVGYAPPVTRPQAPPAPYSVAQSPVTYGASSTDDNHINSGVSGMNN